MGVYGPFEHTYCEPFAEEFAKSGSFFGWFLTRVGLSEWTGRSRSLAVEQRAARPAAKFWSKNYYCHESRCRCVDGKDRRIAGREIDILLLIGRDDGRRHALHIECKHPGVRLSPGQAEGYPVRAACWLRDAGRPRSVLPHDEWATLLICDRAARIVDQDRDAFGNTVFFDEIAERIRPYPMP